ncbi:hypothetical protein [Circoviridae sp.]|nr:hypothetical protein [Circoviridae sp.]
MTRVTRNFVARQHYRCVQCHVTVGYIARYYKFPEEEYQVALWSEPQVYERWARPFLVDALDEPNETFSVWSRYIYAVGGYRRALATELVAYCARCFEQARDRWLERHCWECDLKGVLSCACCRCRAERRLNGVHPQDETQYRFG